MGLETFWTFIWSARFFEMTAQDDTRSVYRVSSGPRRNHVKKGPWCQVVDNGDVCNTSGAIVGEISPTVAFTILAPLLDWRPLPCLVIALEPRHKSESDFGLWTSDFGLQSLSFIRCASHPLRAVPYLSARFGEVWGPFSSTGWRFSTLWESLKAHA